MTESGQSMWIEYMEKFPKEIQEMTKLRGEKDGGLTYNFSGVIYKLS